MRPGDPFGDHGQRAIALAVILEPVFANEDGMGAPAPLTHQRRTGLGHDTRIKGRGAFLELGRQASQAAPQRPGSRCLRFALAADVRGLE